MKMTPTKDRVLFEREKPQETSGGIFVRNPAQTNRARIIAVGKEVTLLKPGDEVIVPLNVGYPLPPFGFVCREHDVAAVMS